MPLQTRILRNLYRDSVALMRVSAELAARPGVAEASAVMATEGNLALLRESGLLEGRCAAGPNDLLVVVRGEAEPLLAEALDHAESAVNPRAAVRGGERAELAPRSMAMAMERLPGANLALVSTPGDYAAAEAFKALRLGLHVMCFSDNVSEEDEIALKRYARAHGLLMMGPDCGTAILNGVPLGFANVVRRGVVGVVAASGTGLQQVTCLIDRMGQGISQAIGTGGRDLHRDVGGITMSQGLEALATDPATRVILIVSKPPAPEVAERLLAQARKAGKPVVVNFLGLDPGRVQGAGLHPARTLEEAARCAADLAAGDGGGAPAGDDSPPAAPSPSPRFAPSQRFLRGLFSGGTFCYEALLLLGKSLGDVYSNTPIEARLALEDVRKSREHTVIDLGDDRFTRGRPHPMIDHRLRNDRIVQEADDPATAVILLDVVLGYGSHPDPAAAMLPAIEEAHRRAARAGRELAFVAFACGTEGDPQDLRRQEGALAGAGVRLATSNAHAVRLAASLVTPRER